MNLQEIFTKAYLGLKSQGFKQSILGSIGCAYRGAGGLKCAVGWCIPDDKYMEEMEGHSVTETNIMRALGFNAAGLDYAELSVWFRHLQHAHDSGDEPGLMKILLQQFAEENGLELPS